MHRIVLQNISQLLYFKTGSESCLCKFGGLHITTQIMSTFCTSMCVFPRCASILVIKMIYSNESMHSNPMLSHYIANTEKHGFKQI